MTEEFVKNHAKFTELFCYCDKNLHGLMIFIMLIIPDAVNNVHYDSAT